MFFFCSYGERGRRDASCGVIAFLRPGRSRSDPALSAQREGWVPVATRMPFSRKPGGKGWTFGSVQNVDSSKIFSVKIPGGCFRAIGWLSKACNENEVESDGTSRNWAEFDEIWSWEGHAEVESDGADAAFGESTRSSKGRIDAAAGERTIACDTVLFVVITENL